MCETRLQSIHHVLIKKKNVSIFNKIYTHIISNRPVINLNRDPRWGRNGEGGAEDPYLMGELAVSWVRVRPDFACFCD